MKILILADGNLQIGMGHVYRTLNLAKRLHSDHNVIFLTKQSASYKFFKKKYKTFFVKKKTNTRKILEIIHPDLIIIDKLTEDEKILDDVSAFHKNILSIDYIGKNRKKINYGITMLYPQTGFSSNKKYSGLQYALINKNFVKNKIKKLKKQVNSILITQGGSDTHCFTPKIIHSLNLIKQELKITVIAGPAFSCWNELNYAINNSIHKIHVLHNVKNMSRIFKKQDIAITAGGMTLLELACVGTPSIIVCGEKFEVETAKLLERHGFGINLGFGNKVTQKTIAKSVDNLIKNHNIRNRMKLRGQKIIDGNGIDRIVAIIESIKTR